MRHEDNPDNAWWFAQPQEVRDRLDGMARRSILDGLARYPFWSVELCTEIVSWLQLENEVAAMHGDWLETIHHRAHAAGRHWDRYEMLRQSRLLGDLTTPPPYLTGEVEQ